MQKISSKTTGKSIPASGQLRADPGQKKGKIPADLIEDFNRAFPLWKSAVEKRTGQLLLSNGAFKSMIKRTKNPKASVKRVTWWGHVLEILEAIQTLWNQHAAEGEPTLHLDWDRFLAPPDNDSLLASLMRPEQAADLSDAPKVRDAAMKHLYQHFRLLRSQVAKAEVRGRHIIEERDNREALASTAEALRLWSYANSELKQLCAIHAQLDDRVPQAQALLRRGIVLYRMDAFVQALAVLKESAALLKRHAPDRAMRTEIKIWDYIGLCYARLGEPEKALSVLRHETHTRRAELLSIPLADASRRVRIGIALSMLGKVPEARRCYVEAAAIRVKRVAYPEAAKAFRYLGLTYFEEGCLHEALVIWDRCVWVQRGYGDDHEAMKLYFFLGQLFTRAAASHCGTIDSEQVGEAGLSEEEKELLLALTKNARSPGNIYRPGSFRRMAREKYDQCLQVAKARGCTSWAKGAAAAIGELAARASTTVRSEK